MDDFSQSEIDVPNGGANIQYFLEFQYSFFSKIE